MMDRNTAQQVVMASMQAGSRVGARANVRTSICAGVLSAWIAAAVLAAPVMVSAQTTTTTGGAAATPPIANAAPDVVQMLNPGDKVQITVFRMPELSGEFLIASDGTISHPVYQSITVTGVPLDTVQERVRVTLLRLQTHPQFVLQALFRVAVGGEVRQPNLYSLPPETTIAQAVAQAGGVTPDGRLNHIQLMRDGTTYTVDLAHPAMALAQMRVHSGRSDPGRAAGITVPELHRAAWQRDRWYRRCCGFAASLTMVDTR